MPSFCRFSAFLLCAVMTLMSRSFQWRSQIECTESCLSHSGNMSLSLFRSSHHYFRLLFRNCPVDDGSRLWRRQGTEVDWPFQSGIFSSPVALSTPCSGVRGSELCSISSPVDFQTSTSLPSRYSLSNLT